MELGVGGGDDAGADGKGDEQPDAAIVFCEMISKESGGLRVDSLQHNDKLSERAEIMAKEIEQAKRVFEEELGNSGLKLISLILFGSRTGKDHGPDSDWDFLLVVNQELDRKEKWDLIVKMKRRLARLKIPNDLLIESEDLLAQKAQDPGTVAHYALKQGQRI